MHNPSYYYIYIYIYAYLLRLNIPFKQIKISRAVIVSLVSSRPHKRRLSSIAAGECAAYTFFVLILRGKEIFVCLVVQNMNKAETQKKFSKPEKII